MSERYSIIRPTPLGRAELERVAATLPDLITATGPDGELRLSVQRAGGLVQPIDWQYGTLSVDLPDADVLAVLIELAARLCARVRDDSLMTWRTPFDSYVHADDTEAVRAQRQRLDALRRRRRLRAWLRAGLIAMTVGMIAARRAGVCTCAAGRCHIRRRCAR